MSESPKTSVSDVTIEGLTMDGSSSNQQNKAIGLAIDPDHNPSQIFNLQGDIQSSTANKIQLRSGHNVRFDIKNNWCDLRCNTCSYAWSGSWALVLKS